MHYTDSPLNPQQATVDIAALVALIRAKAKALPAHTEDIVLAACDTIDQATWGPTVKHG